MKHSWLKKRRKKIKRENSSGRKRKNKNKNLKPLKSPKKNNNINSKANRMIGLTSKMMSIYDKSITLILTLLSVNLKTNKR